MLVNYLKSALNVLRRRKFFTFISLFAISFTLAVLVIAATMLDHVFGAHPPDHAPERTIAVYALRLEGKESQMTGGAGYKFLDEQVRTLPDVERVSIVKNAAMASTYRKGKKYTPYLKHTDGEFWKIYDFEFIEGRPYTVEDDRRANPVAVINRATREKLFGNASGVGQTIELDGQRFNVIGVVENIPLTRFVPFSDVWVPIGTIRSSGYRAETMGSFTGVVLAKRASDVPRIQEEYATRLRNLTPPDPKIFDRMVGAIETPFEFYSRQLLSPAEAEDMSGAMTAVLIAFAVMFMLLPAVNLININISRVLERASEIGVRKAFGASSRALVGQFVVENLVITFAGALLALGVAQIALSMLNGSGLLLYSNFSLNWRVFLYGFLFATFFGLLSGVYPAWRMSRLNPVEALHGGKR